LIKPSRAAGLNVTEHVTVAAQEEDAVAGGIRSVPFEFVVRDFDFRAVVDVSPAERFIRPVIRDAHVGLAVSDKDFIGPVSVCLPQHDAFGASGCIRDWYHWRMAGSAFSH
jgi:hypothetical protein